MKNLLSYVLGISLIILASCSGANDKGFDANSNSEHRLKIHSPAEFNNTDNDTTETNLKPRNTPKALPTDEEEDPNIDLKWI